MAIKFADDAIRDARLLLTEHDRAIAEAEKPSAPPRRGTSCWRISAAS
jgi:hypothetical protein